jgi:hypothetical protein
MWQQPTYRAGAMQYQGGQVMHPAFAACTAWTALLP